jgi:hypothetical protein
MRHLRRVMVTLILVALPSVPSVRAADEAVFDMQEISIFAEARANEEGGGGLFEGASAYFDTDPSPEVKRYPPFKSSRPVYGSVTFGEDLFESEGAVEVYLALDESAPKAAAESASWLGSLFNRVLGRSPETPPAAYDRLYVDVNRDLDLTNDPVLVPMKNPAATLPAGLLPEQMRVFDYLTISTDFGPGLGSRPVRVLPLLYSADEDFAWMTFVLPVARKGEVRIGDRTYTAVLAQQQTITGRFDRPFTRLHLIPRDGSPDKPTGSLGEGDMLCTLREQSGQLYRFRTTPTGDKLTVEPYRGDFGLLDVRAGDRKIDKLGAAGTFYAKEPPMLVSVGKIIHWLSSEKVRQQRLPVGDYWPMRLEVEFGHLEISLAPNRYSEQGDTPIPIRKDTPCVLDVTGRPSVKFVSPESDATIHPGDEVEIEAVLATPVLNLMVTDIKDTLRKTRTLTLTDDDGKPVEISDFESLDPKVVITDAAGKRVAEGEMPFG